MADNFEIVGQVKGDTTGVQADINKGKYSVNATVKADTSMLSSEFKKINQTATFNVNTKGIKDATKVIETFGDNAGRTAEVTKIFSKNGILMSESVSKIKEKLEPFADSANKTSENIKKATSNTEDFNKTANSTSTTLGKTNNELLKTSNNTKTLGQDFIATAGKVAKFGAITAIIGTFTGAISEAIQVVKEFDDTLTDFRKVSDLDGEGLTAYTQKLSEMGTEVARTGTEMLASATKFKQSGFSDEESAQLAKIAELYRNVADEEVSSAEASSFVISQMKAFKIDAKDSITILDSLNSIANNFAVSSSDVAEGMSKSSASLATYGNTLSESMSLVTAGSEVMVGQASRVSRGVVSIGANIVKLADTTGQLQYQIDGATKSIKLFDEAGELKSTYQVLSEVADGWDKMSTAEQSSLALSLAG